VHDKQLPAWLALLTIPGLGPKTSLRLLQILRTPERILSASVEQLHHLKLKPKLIAALKTPNWKTVESCLDWMQQNAYSMITWQDQSYPQQMREISAPPLVLFVAGNIQLLASTQLAMVGSRNPSMAGKESAYRFAYELAQREFTITSGLALGIDAASHRGTLACGGKTIAVLGTGLKHIYPKQHQSLAAKILEQGGAIISEFLPDTVAKSTHFPQRNRIISGLSLGVFVIEAAFHSGSLITAKAAIEQNREVFAMPGSIHNPMAKGCHALLKQGAKLVETIDDILQELPIIRRQQTSLFMKSEPCLQLEDHDKKLVECVGFEVTPIDTIIARSGLTVDLVLARLVMLELQGHIRSIAGGYIRSHK